VIEIVAAVGDTIRDLTPLLRVFSARQHIDEQALRKGLELGDERTYNPSGVAGPRFDQVPEQLSVGCD
jgi:hypothetical protein